MYLTAADYAVTVIMLVIPVGIGVYYAWKDSNNVNREEYLMGGRTMTMLPVSLSMFVTFQSAISLIGFTSDIYGYGIMVVLIYFGNSIGSVIGLYTLVPLMYPLRMSSIFEYLEMRYKSHAVRMFSTVVGMLETFLYMVIALVAPGLALQAAAGIPFWVSVALIGGIGTLYTAIGGIKSVIWADVFQSIILVIGLILLIIKGTMAIGGPEKVFDVAVEGERISLNKFSPDPRTRHTWWGMLIGGCFLWLPTVYNQSNFQRVASIKTLKSAKRAFALNIPFQIGYSLLIGALGIVVYCYFYVTRCDPLEESIISNLNQVSIYFMIHLFKNTPGLAGLYMATIFSGALSTLSSGINALAANTVEDLLSKWLRRVSEKKATIITKIIVFAYGFIIIGVAYLSKALPGPVSQIGAAFVGAFGSVIVGMFLMGCLVPWANKYGVLIGGSLTALLNMWMMIGNLLHGFKTRRLPSAPTDACPSAALDGNSTTLSTVSSSYNFSSSTSTVSMDPEFDTGSGSSPYDYGFFLYDISYEWYGFIGTLVCCVTILIASKLTRRYDETKTEAKLIVPWLRNYWNLEHTQEKDDEEPNHIEM